MPDYSDEQLQAAADASRAEMVSDDILQNARDTIGALVRQRDEYKRERDEAREALRKYRTENGS